MMTCYGMDTLKGFGAKIDVGKPGTRMGRSGDTFGYSQRSDAKEGTEVNRSSREEPRDIFFIF